MGVWVDGSLSWERQVKAVRQKAWYAWHNIKKLTSQYHGLKLSTIILLVKIAIMPIIFYCAPVWLHNKTEQFNDLWYDILKTATGSCCKPSVAKLEVICSLPPLELQINTIIVKFLIKNFLLHDEDLLKMEISHNIKQPRHIIHSHIKLLRDYIGHRTGSSRSVHTINVEDYQGRIFYSKLTMWRFIKQQWENRIQIWQGDEKFTDLIGERPLKTPCSRATEVYLFQCIHGHVSLNSFLWNLSLVSSPLCDCKEKEETPDHVIFYCKEFSEIRDELIIEGDSLLSTIANLARSKDSYEEFKRFCKLMNSIRKSKKASGHKQLHEYFQKDEVQLGQEHH